jgi:ketosteroid isomerase-like protein
VTSSAEAARQLHETFSRGDLAGFLSLWHERCEYHSAIHQVIEGESGVFRGHAGVRRWWADLHDLYEGLESEVRETQEHGDRALVVFVIRGRAAASGMAGEELLAQVVAVDPNGKVLAARDYKSREKALEALRASG